MKKLNFGCGSRFSPGWVNIDVYSTGPEVQRVNLLKKFPFSSGSFDVVYNSHVLEHFPPSDANHLISEACRVLKPGGILRTVVPDLEATCREYLRILDSSHGPDAPKEYGWIILELLDQLTRATPSGEMRAYLQKLKESGDPELLAYVQSRFGSFAACSEASPNWLSKIRGIHPRKIYNKLFYLYLHLVSHAFPRHIRSQVMVLTGLGERHRWMYDRTSLSLLLQKHGFHNITVQAPHISAIPNFNEDALDVSPDGVPRKNVSLYMEATKPVLPEQESSFTNKQRV